MNTWVIIPAAGSGERMKVDVPKVFLKIGDWPVIVHALDAFEKCSLIDGIILVGPEEHLKALEGIVREAGFKKIRRVVAGGATRTQSVRHGLKALDKDVDVVLVHDGARPLVTPAIIEESIKACSVSGAVVVAVPVKPTLKVVDPRTRVVSETLDRTLVWEVQTPQVFKREIIERAYGGDENATDDAALVERLGIPVSVCMGDHRNIKITTPEDLVIAEALLRSRDTYH
ncbi:MAG: 2-C-methyl-D-erythritol 4-phosphate cytidylyltransferase [Candidatus Omnitrophica bacterium]|nr:2-C-methyl-D-erythritol 4-phosphate cytidylyltransferase [Candidatus Omnitrophota bacterium]